MRTKGNQAKGALLGPGAPACPACVAWRRELTGGREQRGLQLEPLHPSHKLGLTPSRPSPPSGARRLSVPGVRRRGERSRLHLFKWKNEEAR